MESKFILPCTSLITPAAFLVLLWGEKSAPKQQTASSFTYYQLFIKPHQPVQDCSQCKQRARPSNKRHPRTCANTKGRTRRSSMISWVGHQATTWECPILLLAPPLTCGLNLWSLYPPPPPHLCAPCLPFTLPLICLDVHFLLKQGLLNTVHTLHSTKEPFILVRGFGHYCNFSK